jgi:hypothetical protein
VEIKKTAKHLRGVATSFRELTRIVRNFELLVLWNQSSYLHLDWRSRFQLVSSI